MDYKGKQEIYSHRNGFDFVIFIANSEFMVSCWGRFSFFQADTDSDNNSKLFS